MSTPAPDSHGSPASLAEHLRQLVCEHLERFVERHAPDFSLPSVFAGHPVGADVRADLAFTLAQLDEAGVREVAGTPVHAAIATVLGEVAGEATHTFWSYRVAETLRRFGPIDDNRLLRSMGADRRGELVAACDSTSWIGLLGEGLPANYAAVLARCELARQALGIDVDGGTLELLLDRCADLLRANPHGYLDDSEDRAGCRYDVYTVDLYLFTEPFAARLEPWWTRGARAAVDLVERVGARDGSVLTWGRSLGCLAHCHTIELAALALERGLTDEPAEWLVRAGRALASFEAGTDGALVDAHRTRGQNRYRGPDRWLQLTFDCLGKLAWAAAGLDCQVDVPARATVRDAYPHRDELVWFDHDRRAAVWSFRSHANAFVLPFVGPAWSDYLPAPREPGRYEVPVDAPLPDAVPVVAVGGQRYTGGGLPEQLEHRPSSVTATWTRLPPVTPRKGHQALDCRRVTSYAIDRHVLHVRERLELDTVPEAVSISVAEADGRPLRVEAQASTEARVGVVVTRGLPEYRSFWGELPRVHEIDVAPAKDLTIEWSVRPLLRVATSDPTHHYHRCLYDPLGEDVTESTFGAHLVDRPDDALRRLQRVDVFHLHWPEWFIVEVERARRFVALLAEAETMLVWTQHNLVPHRDLPGAQELYQVFAEAADVVVHHSEWGRAMVTERYRFGDHARHLLIPHGHFGPLFRAEPPDRARAFEELGLTPDKLCVAIIGAPRRAKRVQEFMDAFAATDREDLQLLVLCVDGETVPEDSRIVARPYEFVPRATYNRWVAVADAIALPFDPAGDMLTTGVVGDVVALGVPAITSSWPYALEALGPAALVYRSPRELVDLLQGLSRDVLEAAGAACRALQPELDWSRLARVFFDELVAAGAFDG